MSDIHQRIKQLRLSKGLSLEGLASIIDVSWQTVQQWEKRSGTAPKRGRLDEVAKALGTTTAYLLTGNNPKAPGVEQPTAPYENPPITRELLLKLIPIADQLTDDGLRELIAFAKGMLAAPRNSSTFHAIGVHSQMPELKRERKDDKKPTPKVVNSKA